jgi:hypothetical protein
MDLYSIRNFNTIIYYLKLNMVRDRKVRIIYFTQTAAIDLILKKIGITVREWVRLNHCTS